ncbi:hydrolase, HAD superfamily [Janthinobacterium sp. Marseille]|nr:HAD family hydrolase [Janthinobacterium sp. Marseille]ABR91642.1 hydrolase, HAD superfamily [Janthinobacterium sp. Marseille]
MTKLNGIRAVAFDVFGTIVEIGDKRRPYKQLMQKIYKAGREKDLKDAELLMSTNIAFSNVPSLFDMNLSPEEISLLEKELMSELSTITLYPEVLFTLNSLKEAGYKIGLCSNLATPYAKPVKELLPFELDAYAWSFEVGAIKPEERIYQKLCEALHCMPNEVLMIGDTLEEDYLGSRSFGMHALHLNRSCESQMAESISKLDELLSIPL